MGTASPQIPSGRCGLLAAIGAAALLVPACATTGPAASARPIAPPVPARVGPHAPLDHYQPAAARTADPSTLAGKLVFEGLQGQV